MRLYLIRHAESANNALYSSGAPESGRASDPEITEIGHKQAALLGPHLADITAEPRQSPFITDAAHQFGLTHLYCSLMTRSILTAGYIARACDLPLMAHGEIFEKGGIYLHDENGVPEGLPGRDRAYFTERFPNLILPDSFRDDGWYNRPAETTADFLVRMPKVVAEICQRHADSDDVVGLVVHGDFIDQFINELMQVDRVAQNYKNGWVANWVFHNTSISRIDFANGGHNVIYLNRIDHLPADLVTW